MKFQKRFKRSLTFFSVITRLIVVTVIVRWQELNILIVTGSGDCTAKAWSLETAKCLRTFHGHLGAINTMATDDSGRTLFTGSMDQTIRSFEVETGRPLFIFRGHDGPVLSISVSAAALYLELWTADKTSSDKSIS